MIRLILFLAVAVALSLLAAWLADHPGRVALTWQGTQVETSIAVLIVAVLLFGAVLVILFEIVRLLGGAPRKIGRRMRRSRVDRGYQALAQGLVAAAAGDTAAARLLNRRADKLLGHAPTTLLLSAQTAQLEGDEGAARVKFQEMLKHNETEFLGLRGLLAQAMKEGDWESALKLARRAYLRRPHTPWVLTTLFDLQTRSGLWTEALSTVGDMARHKLIDRQTATRRRALLFHQQAAAQRAAGRPYEALYLARKAHKLQPDFAPIAVQASALAEQTEQPRIARKVLETAWKAKPHPALAKAYLSLAGQVSPAERLKLVERLQQLQPEHLESELALAEQAIAARAWPTARAALERARKLSPTASVYRLLAEVAQAEGDGDRARAYLAQAVDAAPDHAWLCETT
ncbi:MAG TPA: heme biosynthesis HemY N-terminal domain-containing protein, partial [Myxococcota bacterium]|nr:heme biosynthesis HemY N-terminal domain-containing protein [Myxococcota bacterium]